MRFAAIETSSERCSAALWMQGELAALECDAPNRHGALLLPMLERLLAEAGIEAGALDAVAFGAGPGAFTGVRIACAAAQGFAWAHDLPLLGVSTLAALAENSGAARALACIDARMNEVYYAALERDAAGAWQERVAPQCVAPARAEAPPGADWTGCGSGFGAHGESLRARFGAALGRVDAGLRPNAWAVAKLAAPRLARGEGVDAAQAAPQYLRDRVARTVAERNAS